MISASAYIVACSAKNRFVRRLRRLREPRYLVGAIVGGAYLYFSFFARRRSVPPGGRRTPDAVPGTAAIAASASSMAGVALLVLATIAWVLPFDSGLLEFTGAETDFLFPAPVSRRALLLHRLLRSQIGMLFGSVIVAVASPVPGWTRLRVAAAMWILFLTMRVYFTAVTLMRSRLRASGPSAVLAWAPLTACVAGLGTVAASLGGAWTASPVEDFRDAMTRVADATAHGAPAMVLWPFVALVRPLFASTFEAFATDLPRALLVLGACLAWMLYADDAFQDAAAAAAARRVERAQARGGIVRARATGLSLALSGPPELAFFWKNGVQTLRLTGLNAARIVVAAVTVSVALTSFALNTLHLRGGAAAACGVAMAVAAFTAVLGPQVVRTDLRSDLLHLDLLKTWPVRAASVVRGEMAWPGAMLTAVGWMAIAAAVAFSAAAFPQTAAASRLSIGVGAAIVMPALVFAQFLVQNAAALAFPAWVPLGNQRPRGVDAMGQRVILLGGVLLSVAVLLLPPAIVGGVVWFVFERFVGISAVIPAALAVTLVAAVEIAAATELLGPLYERMDILAVERTE
jgi:hypothetical protein